MGSEDSQGPARTQGKVRDPMGVIRRTGGGPLMLRGAEQYDGDPPAQPRAKGQAPGAVLGAGVPILGFPQACHSRGRESSHFRP